MAKSKLSRRTRIAPLFLILILLVSTLNLSVSADGVDSDFDGWSDEYERIIGTDPHNPDTDGDGIRDPDDPTPNGSFKNTEQVWEAFEFTLHADPVVSAVGHMITIQVGAQKISPTGGRIEWEDELISLYVYVQEYFGDLKQCAVLEAYVVDGIASFSYNSTEPGFHYFIAVANNTGIPLGQKAGLWEISNLKNDRRCDYLISSVYPDYYATIRAKYLHVSPSYSNIYSIELWNFNPPSISEDYLAQYTGSYNPQDLDNLNELYIMTSGDVYVYFNRQGGQIIENVQVGESGLNWNYTISFPAIYSVSVTKYEQQFSWDAALSMKYPYPTITIHNHPDYITTVTGLYSDLLPGHTGMFHIHVKQFSGPTNSADNLYHNSTGAVDVYVAEYYPLTNPLYIRYTELHKTTLDVDLEGVDWYYTFTYAADFAVAATYYTDSFSWYSAPYHEPYGKATLKLHDNLVSWVDFPESDINVFCSEVITVNRVYISNIDEDTFHELFQSIGLIGIAQKHPEYTSPWYGTAYVDVYYLVDNYGSQYVSSNSKYYYKSNYINEWAFRISRMTLQINGSATLLYDFNIPGKYALATSYSTTLTLPAHKFDSRMLPNYCTYLSYHSVATDYIVNSFSAKECYFVGEEVNLSVTNVNGTGPVGTLQILRFINVPSNYKIGDITHLDYAVFSFNDLSSGQYDCYGMPFYDSMMIDIIEELGLEDFSYSRAGSAKNWIGEITFNVQNLAVYSNHPSQFVKGLPASFRVVVYEKDMQPCQECWVDVELKYYRDDSHPRGYFWTKVFHGKTDSSGSVFVNFDFPSDSYRYNNLRISAKKQGREDTIGKSISAREPVIKGVISTDKPMYHEGDIIHAKFLVWNMDTITPLTETLDIILTDHYGRDILKVGVTTDAYGNGKIDIPLADEMPWGTYTLKVARQANGYSVAYKNIEIKHYELPAVRAYFETNLDFVNAGEEVTLPLTVEYMFGAPVTEGNVTYTVKTLTDSYYSMILFPGYPVSGQMEVENGRADITFTVPESNVKRMRVEAEFYDRFDHRASAVYELAVGNPLENDEEIRLEIRSDSTGYIPTDDIPIYISVMKYKTGEYHALEPVGYAQVNLTITVVNINYTRQTILETSVIMDISGHYGTTLKKLELPVVNLLEDMFYYYEIEAAYRDGNGTYEEGATEFKVYRLGHIVTTDKTDYMAGEPCTIKLGVKDFAMNRIAYSNYSLGIHPVAGTDIFTKDGQVENEWEYIVWNIPSSMPSGKYILEVQYDNSTVFHEIQIIDEIPNRLTLNASQDIYIPGDDVELTVQLEKQHHGWVYFDIIAGDDVIFEHHMIEGTSDALSFTCEDWRYPVSVQVYIIDDQGRLISSSVVIDAYQPELKIEIKTDKNTYEPGNRAHLTVKVQDEMGNPIPYPLIGLSIVDQAVFELNEDTTDEAGWFNGFRTPYTLDRNYLVNTNWPASVWYPSALHSETTVFWPDYKPGHSYRGQWDTNYSLFLYDAVTLCKAYGTSPNSAGKLSSELQSELERTDVRDWFTETAFWDAGITADVNGSFTLDVLLPDNIAQWRIKAIASTKDCLGTVGITFINTSKDFFIEPQIPYVFFQDDEITFKFRVYNFNEKALTITVGLSAGPWLLVFGPNEVTMVIDAMEVKEMGFMISIVDHGRQNFTFIATDFGDNVDAVTGVCNIRPNGALKTQHLTGAVDHKVSETVKYFDERIIGSEYASLRLAVGYQGLLLDGFGALGDYPYGCTEQTMSRLLPNILMWEYYDAMDELSESRKIWLSKIIVLEIQRLYYYQQDDGGWGWWKADDTDVWMTAYVLFGLGKAREAGFYVSPTTLEGAQQCLLDMMDTTNDSWKASGWLADRDAVLSAYVVLALACSDYEGSLTMQWKYLEDAWDAGDLDDPYGAALYVQALQEVDKKQKAAEAVNWLVNHKTGPHWDAGSSMGGADETTGWVAYALTREGDHKGHVRGALEWLAMLRMPNGGWGTTSDTIAAMFAIVEVVKAMEEVDMTIEVYVNKEKIKQIHVDETSYESMRNFKSSMDAINLGPYMKPGENTVEIKKMGKGDLFHEITAVQYLRIGIFVDYEEGINTGINELFTVEVTVDPVNSQQVDVTNLKLDIPEMDGLVLLSSDMTASDSPDGPYQMTNTYYAEEAGTYAVQPILVQYQLDAGERDSGIIRRYYGPIMVNVCEHETRGTRGPECEPEGVLTKRASNTVVRTGGFVDITISLDVDSSLLGRNIEIVDFVPSSFVVVDSGEGRFEDGRLSWETTADEDLTLVYSLRAMDDFNGELGRAVAILDESIIDISEPLNMVSTSKPFFVLREFNTHSTQVFTPVTVRLTVKSLDEPVWYVVLEDHLAAGCRFDKESISVLEDGTWTSLDSSHNVQSYKVVGDKIAFFIKNGQNVSVQYSFVPTLASNVIVPSAKVYSMYNESIVAFSGADLLNVENSEAQQSSDGGTTTVVTGPDGPGDGGATPREDEYVHEQDTHTIFVAGILTLIIAIPFATINLITGNRHDKLGTEVENEGDSEEQPNYKEENPT